MLGQSRARTEADPWIAFRSHFGIESFYCRPGIEGAHEKVVFHDRARRLLSVNYRIVVATTTLAELTRQ
ncbi:hypothetical protein OG949_00655 [Streptomyces scopuliridis]|uniref:hypothetical protein n=1 Tax=Streptomyces scopuliridis TaxID=452529 RepID=UPI002DD8AB4A|nr:hypothetical protein [Streptomyces scopuliridis]WSB31540.1 hypothetical protein OG949_00655 [Streptomyces scopuliridis]